MSESLPQTSPSGPLCRFCLGGESPCVFDDVLLPAFVPPELVLLPASVPPEPFAAGRPTREEHTRSGAAEEEVGWGRFLELLLSAKSCCVVADEDPGRKEVATVALVDGGRERLPWAREGVGVM